MRHDDGDEEDLEEAEAAAALAAFEHGEEAPPAEMEVEGEGAPVAWREEACRDAWSDSEEEDEGEEWEAEAEGGAAAQRVEQVLGRRWAASGRKGTIEYLVKFKGLSYLHAAWCREAQLLRKDPKLLTRLKAFARVAPPLPPPPAAAAVAAATLEVAAAAAAADEASAEVTAALSVSSAFAVAAAAPAVRLTLDVRTVTATATAAAAAAAAASKAEQLTELLSEQLDMAEFLPERALEVEQVLATRRGADGGAEVLVKWEVLPWSESSWEREVALPPCAAQLAAYDAAQRAPCVPPSAAVAAIRPTRYEQLKESPTYGPNQDRKLRP